MEESGKFLRIIIRRPHAYAFAAANKGVTIPGVAFFDAEGRVTGNCDLTGDVKSLLAEMAKQQK